MPAPSPFRLQTIAAPPVTRENVSDISAPPGGPGRGELDLWLLPGPALAQLSNPLAALPPEEERRACHRLTSQAAQRCCLLQRGATRAILSGYAGRPAQELRMTRAAGGKPQLADEPDDGLRFNLSHTGDLLAIACARGVEVGVDLERISPTRPIEAIATRYFHPREADFLGTLGDEAKRHQFFRWWTGKEALLKAQGLGISNQLSRLDLSAWVNQPAAEITVEDGSNWFAAHLAVHPGCALAVACAQVPAQIRIRALAAG